VTVTNAAVSQQLNLDASKPDQHEKSLITIYWLRQTRGRTDQAQLAAYQTCSVDELSGATNINDF